MVKIGSAGYVDYLARDIFATIPIGGMINEIVEDVSCIPGNLNGVGGYHRMRAVRPGL